MAGWYWLQPSALLTRTSRLLWSRLKASLMAVLATGLDLLPCSLLWDPGPHRSKSPVEKRQRSRCCWVLRGTSTRSFPEKMSGKAEWTCVGRTRLIMARDGMCGAMEFSRVGAFCFFSLGEGQIPFSIIRKSRAITMETRFIPKQQQWRLLHSRFLFSCLFAQKELSGITSCSGISLENLCLGEKNKKKTYRLTVGAQL